jgi:hypothetical protein
MSDIANKEQRKISRTLLDIFVVLFCISGAAASLYFFIQDLYATFRLSDIYKVGIVTDQSKTIRRRPSSKKVWERLVIDSPVYNGDYVRNDDQFSSATLDIEGNKVRLGENTFIRVKKDMGRLNIEQIEGNTNISVASGRNKGESVFLVLRNQTVEILPETEVNAVSGDDGLIWLNFTGSGAKIISDGQVRSVSDGEIIIQDADGNEVRTPMIAVIQPKPNAQLIKNGSLPLNVEFKWSRINMQQQDILQLEIAGDKNFTRQLYSADNLDSRTTNIAVNLNAKGLIFWRLLHEGIELASGHLNVLEASAPALLAPASNSAGIPVKFVGEEVQFRWAEVPSAMYYILQISDLENFNYPEVELPVQVSTYISSDIDIGTWYWRVKPVFPGDYEGAVGYSKTSSFQIKANIPAVSENNSDTNAADAAPVESVAAVKEEPDEDKSNEELFLALQKETNQIWQEQQVIQARLAQQTQAAQQQAARQTQAAQQTQPAQLQQSSQTQTVQAPAQQQARSETQQQTLRLTLVAPAQNTVIPGLTALRQPTIFRWDTNEDIEFARFVLSRNANPVSGRPEIDIQNPGRTVSIPVLAEGVWYWTVEGRTRNGQPVTAAAPRQIHVQPVLLLPAPQNRMPETGYLIDADEIRRNRNIVFSWAGVNGANSYILTILRDGFPRKQQIFQTEPLSELTYTLEDFSFFSASGKFYWQVEAAFYNSNGRLEQGGTPGENEFTLDVPRPGQVRTRSGTFYGR